MWWHSVSRSAPASHCTACFPYRVSFKLCFNLFHKSCHSMKSLSRPSAGMMLMIQHLRCIMAFIYMKWFCCAPQSYQVLTNMPHSVPTINVFYAQDWWFSLSLFPFLRGGWCSLCCVNHVSPADVIDKALELRTSLHNQPRFQEQDWHRTVFHHSNLKESHVMVCCDSCTTSFLPWEVNERAWSA